MTSSALRTLACDALDDLKGVDIKVLDVTAMTGVTDFMVIATGRSERQIRALAESVVMRAKAQGVQPLGVEGLDGAQWVLVDLCDVVVHVMNADARDTYQLEKLWQRPARLRVQEIAGAASETTAHEIETHDMAANEITAAS
ncbi:MAG: ribosome silencing factor [Gammaproteobacteria bacterium]|nr:ribosome silencing factor [Gammaproteobacteria bacterium]